MSGNDSLLDELFHGCAVAAFVEQARLEGGWPAAEATRLRAFQLYEQELAARPLRGTCDSGGDPRFPDDPEACRPAQDTACRGQRKVGFSAEQGR